MSGSFFHKPENALRRALELQSISQPESALTLLHDVLSSRRHKTWSPTYEQIMLLYIDLCLSKNKSREAKDGLHQYRNLSQSQAPGSLENVIHYLLSKSEAECARARKTSESLAASDPSDTPLDDDAGDEFATNQSILLSTMSLDPGKTQRETAVVLPSLKFLWEAYRAVLDILRSNSKLEHLYHGTTRRALAFCKEYKRRTEFRRLCDMLRQHLGNLQKYGGGTEDGGKMNSKIRGWEGWTAESIELHLQSRFLQLSTASHLHLYTEGFRTVEDIYNILQISNAQSLRLRRLGQIPAGTSTAPKAKLMATYYQKLTTLFWVSENHLFHAFAWYKYYTLCKECNKGMTGERKKRLASTVLLSALCIPESGEGSYTSHNRKHRKAGTAEYLENPVGMLQEEETLSKEKMSRMATLLGFHTKHPTREALLAELKAMDILNDVPQYLRDLYYLLEEKSDALLLVNKARPLLARLKTVTLPALTDDTEEKKEEEEEEQLEDTNPYKKFVKPLTDILLLKLLINLSTAYYTVSLPFLRELITQKNEQGDTLGLTFQQVEKTIVQLSHRSATAPQSSSRKFSVKIDHRTQSLRFTTSSLWEDTTTRTHLTQLSQSLSSLLPTLTDTPITKDIILPPRQEFFQGILSALPEEHAATILRKTTIEKRKEETERVLQEKLTKETLKKRTEENARKREESKRLQQESRNREHKKLMKIQKEMENTEKLKYLKAMGKDVEKLDKEELDLVDTAKLVREARDQAKKKKDDADRKLATRAKKLDYITRAVRLEEQPLVVSRYEEQVVSDKQRYETDIIEKARKAKELWERCCVEKEVMQKFNLFDKMNSFQNKAMQRREMLHEEACVKEEQVATAKAEENKKIRAEGRRVAENKRREEERKKREEEDAKQRAEEDRLARELERKKKEEMLEKKAKEREEERKQMDEKRRSETQEDESFSKGKDNAPRSAEMEKFANDGKGMYVPPSQRNRDSGPPKQEGGSRWGAAAASASRGGGFGGGRYAGKNESDAPSDNRGSAWGRTDNGGGNRFARSDGGRDRDSQRGPPEQRNSRWG